MGHHTYLPVRPVEIEHTFAAEALQKIEAVHNAFETERARLKSPDVARTMTPKQIFDAGQVARTSAAASLAKVGNLSEARERLARLERQLDPQHLAGAARFLPQMGANCEAQDTHRYLVAERAARLNFREKIERFDGDAVAQEWEDIADSVRTHGLQSCDGAARAHELARLVAGNPNMRGRARAQSAGIAGWEALASDPEYALTAGQVAEAKRRLDHAEDIAGAVRSGMPTNAARIAANIFTAA